MKINIFQYYKNIVKSKLLPNSKSDFISTLLYRDNKKSISKGNTISKRNRKNIIIAQIKLKSS